MALPSIFPEYIRLIFVGRPQFVTHIFWCQRLLRLEGETATGKRKLTILTLLVSALLLFPIVPTKAATLWTDSMDNLTKWTVESGTPTVIADRMEGTGAVNVTSWVGGADDDDLYSWDMAGSVGENYTIGFYLKILSQGVDKVPIIAGGENGSFFSQDESYQFLLRTGVTDTPPLAVSLCGCGVNGDYYGIGLSSWNWISISRSWNNSAYRMKLHINGTQQTDLLTSDTNRTVTDLEKLAMSYEGTYQWKTGFGGVIVDEDSDFMIDYIIIGDYGENLDPPERTLTVYWFEDCCGIFVNGTSYSNGSAIAFGWDEVANITSSVCSPSENFFKRFIYNSTTTYDDPFYLTMDYDYTVNAYCGTRFEMDPRLWCLILGWGCVFIPPLYIAYKRPSLPHIVALLMVMVVGFGLLQSVIYF